MRTCTARKVYKLSTDAPDDESIIALAEKLAGGLDSHDLGDAMGAFCELAGDDDRVKWVGDGFTVTMTVDWDLFTWEEPS